MGDRIEVIVGNIGTVYDCHGCDGGHVCRQSAEDTFLTYVRLSESGSGRAAGEAVVMYLNDEPVMSYGLAGELA